MRPFILVWLALAACGPASSTRTDGDGTLPAPVAAPHARMFDLAVDLDGDQVGPLAPDQRATIVIVFASWCVHCRNEVHELEVLRAEHPDLRFLGVNYKAHEEYDGRGDAAAVRAFVAERAPWLRVIPADETLWTALGRPPKVPTLFIFDRSGALARTYDRRVDPLPGHDDLDAAIAALP